MQTVTKAEAGFKVRGEYVVEIRDRHGKLKYPIIRKKNLITNAGLNDILDKHLKGSSYTAAWYVGLKSTGTIAAADTSSSHGGWTEDQNYSESVRQTLTLGTVSSQSVSNTASKAVFTMNGSTTIGGIFVISVNTKGGTTGVLFSAIDFGSSRSVVSTDTITVTYTVSCADS